MSAVYNLRSSGSAFTVTKFDDDMNVESSYEMTIDEVGVIHCGCPAGVRPSCRHRQMFTQLQSRVDSAWMLDFDTRLWVDPTGEAEPIKQPLRNTPRLAGFEIGEDTPESKPITRSPDSHPYRIPRRL